MDDYGVYQDLRPHTDVIEYFGSTADKLVDNAANGFNDFFLR